ncbi:MAG: enoyl-CoA hydratase/isomerase family protein [Caulobacteraceae bacterium]|nr:enoyl-CoA hydratase/isomerase family protein [Caulobacter sp.]
MSDEAPVIVRVERGVGRLTLNRPKALHALTTTMCREMITALLAWRDDAAVRAVLLDSAPPRGFCAGGDIRALSSAQDDGGAAAREFFRVEYRLNTLLYDFPKPTVALMDGVVMGGGVGISAPCRLRVATERTTFAMPETAIGLFPDVGGGWWLPRLPGKTGLWLALTGARLKAADMLLLGLATDYVESDKLPELVDRILADPAALETALTAAESGPGQPGLAKHTGSIDSLFAGESVAAILQALDADGGEWASAQAALLRRMSPQALAVTFRQLQLGAEAQSFAEEMAREYDLAGNVVMQPDMAEGVRALLVDKDNAPRWSPPSLSQVAPALVDGLFAPREGDHWTPLPSNARTGDDA